jgi:anthranilate synthase component 2
MQIAIIDNYDSFTYNLVHAVEKINQKEVTVFLNDQFELQQLETFDKIILSPGPGLPQQAGKTLDVIDKYKSTKSILGVCLGHQAIGVAFGSKLKNLDTVFHGIATNIYLTKSSTHLFNEIEMPMQVGRYHSWVIDENTLSKDLQITSVDKDRNIMSIKHKQFDIESVQFHPESIMTTSGEMLLRNWIKQ